MLPIFVSKAGQQLHNEARRRNRNLGLNNAFLPRNAAEQARDRQEYAADLRALMAVHASVRTFSNRENVISRSIFCHLSKACFFLPSLCFASQFLSTN